MLAAATISRSVQKKIPHSFLTISLHFTAQKSEGCIFFGEIRLCLMITKLSLVLFCFSSMFLFSFSQTRIVKPVDFSSSLSHLLIPSPIFFAHISCSASIKLLMVFGVLSASLGPFSTFRGLEDIYWNNCACLISSCLVSAFPVCSTSFVLDPLFPLFPALAVVKH